MTPSTSGNSRRKQRTPTLRGENVTIQPTSRPFSAHHHHSRQAGSEPWRLYLPAWAALARIAARTSPAHALVAGGELGRAEDRRGRTRAFRSQGVMTIASEYLFCEAAAARL